MTDGRVTSIISEHNAVDRGVSHRILKMKYNMTREIKYDKTAECADVNMISLSGCFRYPFSSRVIVPPYRYVSCIVSTSCILIINLAIIALPVHHFRATKLCNELVARFAAAKPQKALDMHPINLFSLCTRPVSNSGDDREQRQRLPNARGSQ